MKKIILFISVILITGCCALSRIPTQYIYADAGSCEAILLDYTAIIPVTDNCLIASYTQTSQAGFILSPTNMSVDVTLTAIDISGNTNQRVFLVIFVDTIKPQFVIPDSLLSYRSGQIDSVYNVGDRMIAFNMQLFNEAFPFDLTPILLEMIACIGKIQCLYSPL